MNVENLSVIEFNQTWLLTCKFLGPPCEKLFRDKSCHDLRSVFGSQPEKNQGNRVSQTQSWELSRKDERECRQLVPSSASSTVFLFFFDSVVGLCSCHHFSCCPECSIILNVSKNSKKFTRGVWSQVVRLSQWRFQGGYSLGPYLIWDHWDHWSRCGWCHFWWTGGPISSGTISVGPISTGVEGVLTVIGVAGPHQSSIVIWSLSKWPSFILVNHLSSDSSNGPITNRWDKLSYPVSAKFRVSHLPTSLWLIPFLQSVVFLCTLLYNLGPGYLTRYLTFRNFRLQSGYYDSRNCLLPWSLMGPRWSRFFNQSNWVRVSSWRETLWESIRRLDTQGPIRMQGFLKLKRLIRLSL